MFGGFAGSRKAAFDEIDVHRINIVEPDGTLRQVISDKAKFPGSFVNGKEIARPDRHDNGQLFLNGEGTKTRLVIRVAADGSPSIQFLNEVGRVASQLPAPNWL